MRGIQAIIFDLNETLLDLESLKVPLAELFRHEKAFELWFQKLLHMSLVSVATDSFSPFDELAAKSLRSMAMSEELKITDQQIKEVLKNLLRIPAFPDALPALTRLKNLGFRLFLLTNGSPKAMLSQVSYAGLDHLFEAMVSVSEVGSYKPDPKVYQYVLDKYALKRESSLMVAAHDWDIQGASKIEMPTAFLLRKGKYPYPGEKPPDWQGASLHDLVNKLQGGF